MKKKLLITMIAFVVLFSGCIVWFNSTQEVSIADYPPMLYVQDQLFMITEPFAVTQSYLGESIGQVLTYEEGKPNENFESNLDIVGCDIYLISDNQLVIFYKEDEIIYMELVGDNDE